MLSDAKSKVERTGRILVLGTDAGSREVILEPLRWESWDARGARNLDEATFEHGDFRPQIILFDACPTEASGNALKDIRARHPHASVLYLSDQSSTESLILGLDQGADDYIVKPFVPLELLARLRTHFRMRELHEQLVQANEQLKELVDIDDLTGLYNMRSLYQRLEFEMERGRRYGRQVCVIMMDMDNFKSVNDGHDHLFGSYVLSEMGKIIKDCTRNIDIPARYGGDEFLIVLSEINEVNANLFCERLRRRVQKTVFRSGTDSIMLTLSLGYALTDGTEIISPKELVRKADHALYDAKRNGRDRVCGYSDLQAKVLKFEPKKAVATPSRRKKAAS